jgi:hypothetical protein
MATDPAGTRVRGVARRGKASFSWNEPDNVDAVRALSVKGNNLRFAHPHTLGDVSEVWSKFTAIANVYFYFRPARLADVPGARGEMTKP